MNVHDLQQKSCKPCEGGAPALPVEQAQSYLENLDGWSLLPGGKAISKEFAMKNFRGAVQFIQRIGDLAEREGHHPDLHLTRYRKLRVELSTHVLGGLSENDFILASKIEGLGGADA